jgi:hypothetical protein
VIEALKDAFADGRLARDELDARAGRALTARTYADLAALTADIPAAARRPRSPAPPAPARRPLARAAVMAGICLIIGFVAWWIGEHADTNPASPGPHPFHFLPIPMAMVFTAAGFTAVGILGHGTVTSWQLRRSRGQLPPGPGPGPGGRILEGDGVPALAMIRFPAPLAATRPAPTCRLTTHGRTGGTFPLERTGHRVA